VAEGLLAGADGKIRCAWCGDDPLYRAYHDEEWGRPTADDRYLFEKLCLEGFQSGLSWLTILRKRENFRRAFAGFDADALSAFGPADVDRLLADPGIVRHRGKIESVLNNARRARELREEAGSLAAFVWRYRPDPASRPERLDWATLRTLASTLESTALSKELRRRGWSFVGPTTVYAFMQAVGIVNDHVEGCASREEIEREQQSSSALREDAPAQVTPAARGQGRLGTATPRKNKVLRGQRQ
jgi:DNA-3-methyladenine glycosylase I